MSRTTRGFFGGLLVLAGAVLVGNNLGLYEVGESRTFLPALLVLWGVWSLVRHRFRRLFGPLLLVLIGVLWQLVMLGRLTAAEAWNYWPLVVVLLGVTMVLGRPRRRPLAERHGDRVELVSITEAVDHRFDPSAQHGEATAVFGEVTVDCYDEALEPPVTLEAVAVFGDVTVRVPDDWTVETDAVSILGRVTDDRPDQSPSGGKPDLTLSGVAVFGNITLTS